MTERQYQAKLIQKLKSLFPGCTILKNDPSYQQGIPDLTILYGRRWGLLEVKASCSSPVQPNQKYFIDSHSDQSFAAFIFPENEEEVLNALQEAFRS